MGGKMNVCSDVVESPMKLRILPNLGTVVLKKIVVKHADALNTVLFQLKAIKIN